jgi:hypothetical protein
MKKFRSLIQTRRCEKSRPLRTIDDEDGSLVIKGRFPGEQGALLMKALALSMDRAEADANTADVSAETPDADATEDTRQPVVARRADALMEVAESFLASGPESSSSADRYQVLLHVSAETSKRICCDSNIIPILTGKLGEPLGIGRKSRTIPPAMRRALKMRDQGCRFPGCTHRHFIDGHHIEHWAEGGETSLDNLVLLCRHHHRPVHEGGFTCETSEAGQLVFRNEAGKVFGHSGSVPQLRPNALAQRRIQERLEELYIEAGTCVTRWEGERMDYGLASELLWIREFPED